MNFFLEKQLIKFSCTYWPLSFCKILKKFLGLIQSYEDVPFLGPKWPICHEQNFFGTNHYYYFHLLIGPFHCAKFKKILTADPELQDAPFLGPKWSICLNFGGVGRGVGWGNYYHSHLPISPFHCAEFKKIFQRIQSYEDVQFLGPKWPICPNENFFEKPVNEPYFLHSCLPTCQKSVRC